MDYIKVLEQHKKLMTKGNEWWLDFFYHFTDVHNAVGIIEGDGSIAGIKRKLRI